MTPPVNTCGPPQIQNTMMNVTVKEGQEATFKCMVRISHVDDYLVRGKTKLDSSKLCEFCTKNCIKFWTMSSLFVTTNELMSNWWITDEEVMKNWWSIDKELTKNWCRSEEELRKKWWKSGLKLAKKWQRIDEEIMMKR